MAPSEELHSRNERGIHATWKHLVCSPEILDGRNSGSTVALLSATPDGGRSRWPGGQGQIGETAQDRQGGRIFTERVFSAVERPARPCAGRTDDSLRNRMRWRTCSQPSRDPFRVAEV